MKQELITISPIDGREIVRRPYVTEAELPALLARAKAAQRVVRKRISGGRSLRSSLKIH